MSQTATPTVKPKLCEVGQKTVVIKGTLALAGTYASPGPTFDLTTFVGFPVQKAEDAWVRIYGSPSSDHAHEYVAAAGDLTAGTVKSTVVSTGLELAGAAYPAAITGDTIWFEVVFRKH